MRNRLNPLQCAGVLVWAAALGALAPTLVAQTPVAQTPCELKKQYDAAQASAKAAEAELATHQTTHGRKVGKLPDDKATLEAKLAAAKSDAASAKQVSDDAEAAHTAAKAAIAAFDAAPQHGAKRMAEIPTLIKLRDGQANQTKNPTTHTAELTRFKAAKALLTQVEDAIKAQMPGIDLTVVDPTDQVDSDVRKFEQSLQANLTASGGIIGRVTAGSKVDAEVAGVPPVTTGLRCPGVTGVNDRMRRTDNQIQAAMNNYETVDQSAPNAAGMRTTYLRQAQDLEKGRPAILQDLKTEVLKCADAVKADLSTRLSRNAELAKLDPDGSLERESQQSATQQPDNSLERELAELTARKKALDQAEKDARDIALKDNDLLAAANALVKELELSLKILAAEAAAAQAEPAYNNAVTDKDLVLPDARADLALANTFLTAVGEVEPSVLQFKRDFAAWKKQVADWKSAKGPPAGKAELLSRRAALGAEKARIKALLTKNRFVDYAALCTKKEEYRDHLEGLKSRLDPYRCFPAIKALIDQIDATTPRLSSSSAESGVLAAWTPGRLVVGFATFSPGAARRPSVVRPASVRVRSAVSARRAKLLAGLQCTPDDLDMPDALASLDDPLEFDDADVATPTDSVPDDLVKNTGEVKVARYFVFTLTGASGGLWVGDEDVLKTRVHCSFEGGGRGCGPTDYVTYKKLLGPFPSQEEAQLALCKSITATRIFPVGIGLKGQWQGGTTWYGLWDASVSDCPKQ